MEMVFTQNKPEKYQNLVVPKTRFAFGIAGFDGTQNAFCLRNSPF
jgi:hypothetical protein